MSHLECLAVAAGPKGSRFLGMIGCFCGALSWALVSKKMRKFKCSCSQYFQCGVFFSTSKLMLKKSISTSRSTFDISWLFWAFF